MPVFSLTITERFLYTELNQTLRKGTKDEQKILNNIVKVYIETFFYFIFTI